MTGVAKGSVRVEYGGEEVVGGGIAAYHKGAGATQHIPVQMYKIWQDTLKQS